MFRGRSNTQRKPFSLSALLVESTLVEGFLWDCVTIEVVEDKDAAWDCISINVGQITNVNSDGNCGYWAFIEAFSY